LEGKGRQTRYLTFATPAEVDEKAVVVAMLLREAVALKV
jgi:hypothetical protein